MKRDNMVKFRAHQSMIILKLLTAYLVSLFYKKREIWLIGERGVDACDNGYWLFTYIKKNHPEIDVRYIISNDSVDRRRLLQYENALVDYRSFKHCLLLWRATHLISTHVQGYAPFVGLGIWMNKHIKPYNLKWHIDLKHGVTKDKLTFVEYSNTLIDLLICAAKPEYDYMLKTFGFPEGNLQYTGFCRFDNLFDVSIKPQILIMPTWREWIYSDKLFASSEFAKVYSDLLVDPELNELLEKNDINLVFYPHHEIQRYIGEFKKLPVGSHVIIADKANYDLQQMLKESAVLVTDYSSVFFDFAYMKKPVLYFQFDYERYRSEHLVEGYFDYHKGFGPVLQSKQDLLASLQRIIQNEFKVEKEYLDRIEEFFPLHDNKNTERVYNCIVAMTSARKKSCTM